MVGQLHALPGAAARTRVVAVLRMPLDQPFEGMQDLAADVLTGQQLPLLESLAALDQTQILD